LSPTRLEEGVGLDCILVAEDDEGLEELWESVQRRLEVR
jgi:hypothetical protein